jgi:UDP-N-acetylglucosamine acyltransferase
MSDLTIEIHSTSVVHAKAQLSTGVKIGPYAIIDEHVKLGEGTTVGPHAVITGRTTMGRNNRVFAGAVIGSEPQDVKFHGEETYLVIGDGNLFREHCTINPGTGEGSRTVIGDDNWFMIQTHVGHNCVIGSHIKLANLATLGGHVLIEDYVTIGGVTPIHQFCRVGCYSMIGGGFRAVQDVTPYMIAGDEPLRIHGINQIGLERNGFSKETVETLKKAHKVIFRNKLTLKEAVKALQDDFPPLPEIKHLIEFLGTCERGLVR